MKNSVRNDFQPVREVGAGAIRRRHIIYAEAYDPRGPKWYFDLFQRTCDRFQELWPVTLTLQPLEMASADFAHWRVDARGLAWQVTTHYDFLRLESFVQSEMARPTAWQLIRGSGWLVGDVLSGAQFRMFRASWRFDLHLLYFQGLLVAWLAVPALFAVLVARTATHWLNWSVPLGVITALLAAIVALFALRPVADRSHVLLFSSCWASLRRFGRGRPTWLDHAIDVGARRVIEVAQANEADELAVVGHSTGGVTASAIMARALELNPDLGRSGPRLVLLTLGSVMPGVALHPAAQRMRNIIKRLATEPSLSWIDCQSGKDVLCFANFDSVEGSGVHVGAQRRNPLLWQISFKEMISPEEYRSFRQNRIRVHFQYIMAGDRPAPYDFIWVAAGPMPIAEWPKRHEELKNEFLQKSLAMNVATTTL